MSLVTMTDPPIRLIVGCDYDLKNGSRRSFAELNELPDDVLAELGIVKLTTLPIPKHKRILAEVLKLVENVPTLVREYEEYPIDEYRNEKLNELANIRWEREIGGMSFGMARIATDDRSKLMIIGAREKAKENPVYSTLWKVAPGQYIELQAPMLIALADAIEAHVSACFTNEERLSKLLLAAQTHDDIDVIDLTNGWPE